LSASPPTSCRPSRSSRSTPMAATRPKDARPPRLPVVSPCTQRAEGERQRTVVHGAHFMPNTGRAAEPPRGVELELRDGRQLKLNPAGRLSSSSGVMRTFISASLLTSCRPSRRSSSTPLAARARPTTIARPPPLPTMSACTQLAQGNASGQPRTGPLVLLPVSTGRGRVPRLQPPPSPGAAFFPSLPTPLCPLHTKCARPDHRLPRLTPGPCPPTPAAPRRFHHPPHG